MQKEAGSRLDDVFFYRRTPCQSEKIPGLRRDDVFFEIFFRDRRCEKAASQSLSYGIFAKTSGHFRTFSCTYAEGEKLEGTLVST